ncbi:MAG: hypothetical protein ACXAEN_25090, partial [Candidatus Thorarchaeota archaeon]
MLEEFERREEVSDQEFQDQYNKELSRRSVAGTNSTLLTVPGDFVPSDMTAKFSIDASNVSENDLLITGNSDVEKIAEYLDIPVDPNEIGEIEDVLNPINKAILRVFNGERSASRDIELSEEEVKALEGILKFTGGEQYAQGLHEMEGSVASDFEATEFSGDLLNGYNKFFNGTIPSPEKQIATNLIEDGYVISAVQDYNEGLSFIDAGSRSTSEENILLPMPLIVALSDLGKLQRAIKSGKELNTATIASLHRRYVAPILNSFKDGSSGAREGRMILRSLDLSPEGLSSGLKGDSVGGNLATPFKLNLSDSNFSLYQQIARLQNSTLDDYLTNRLLNHSLSIPFQRAYASIFKYIFEKTSSRSTTPLYRGTTLSRFLFDASSKEEAQSISDPSYETALDWAKENTVGREISIDGLGELSSDINTSDEGFSEGVLFVLPTGSVMSQSPSSERFRSEAGTFTSGTFVVESIDTYNGPAEFRDAKIRVIGRQIIDAAEIKRKVLDGELKKADIFEGFIPLINENFTDLSGDLFAESEEGQNSYMEWTDAVSSQVRPVRTNDTSYIFTDSDPITEILSLMMADGAVEELAEKMSETPSIQSAFRMYENGGMEFSPDDYDQYMMDQDQFKPDKSVELLDRAVSKDPAFRKSLIRAISFLTSGKSDDSSSSIFESDFIQSISDTDPSRAIYKGISLSSLDKSHKDEGLPRDIRYGSGAAQAGARGAFVTLRQKDNEMKSFGGKFLVDENAARERSPVIGWTRPPKWSIVNVDEEGFQLVGGQTGSNEGGMYR